MTDDRPDPPGDEHARGEPELDAAREAAVRALLDDARETGPAPPAVTARLDEALAALGRGAEPSGAGSTGSASVVPIRRRRIRQALVAAGAVAATAVVAVPVTMSITGQSGDEGSTSASGGAAAERPDAVDQAAPEALKPSEGQPSEAEPGELGQDRAGDGAPLAGSGAARDQEEAPDGGELLLSRGDFDEQVTALVESGGLGPVPAARCGAPRRGRTIAIRYDGALGALRLVPAEDAVRAELYVCGRPGVVRERDVPTR